MNDIQIFDFQDNPVRVQVDENDNPWWIAKDVCEALGLTNVSQAVANLDEDEKGIFNIYTLGGQQNVLAITEPGLYGLLLISRKDKAKQFKRWIKHDVTPAIRKTGTYSVNPVNPDAITRTQLAQMVIDSEKAREALEGQVKKLQLLVS